AGKGSASPLECRGGAGRVKPTTPLASYERLWVIEQSSEEGLSMIKLGRATTICCLFVAMLVFTAPSRAQTRPAIAKQIAQTYGLDTFRQIEGLRYTWNLEAPGFKVSRSWVWQPKTDQVSYEGKD